MPRYTMNITRPRIGGVGIGGGGTGEAPQPPPPPPPPPTPSIDTYWDNTYALANFTDCGWGGVLQECSGITNLSETTYNGVPCIKSEALDHTQPCYSGGPSQRAQALRWAHKNCSDRFDSEVELYAGCRILLPTGFDVLAGDWWLAFQLHEQGEDGKLGFFVSTSEKITIEWDDVAGGRPIVYVTNNVTPLPINEWFTIILHINYTTINGWFNGVEFGAVSPGGNHFEPPGGASQPGWFLSAGMYQNTSSSNKAMYFRDCVAAPTLTDVVNYLAASDPEA